MKPRSKASDANRNCRRAIVFLDESGDAFDGGGPLEDGDGLLGGGEDGEGLGA